MPTELQFRRYAFSEINTFTGKMGEIFIHMDGEWRDNQRIAPENWSLRIHDGVTPGGIVLSNWIGDLVGNVVDSPILTTAFDAKADLINFNSHITGTGFLHSSNQITFDGTQAFPPSSVLDVNAALLELYQIKSDVIDSVRKDEINGIDQTIAGQTTSYLRLDPIDNDGLAGLFIGSTNHPGGSGAVSTLRLYSTLGFYYDLVTDATTGLFALDFYNGATTETIITTNAQADLIVNKNLRVNGNIYLGDNQLTDTITVVADFSSDLIPSTPDTYNLGTSIERWNTLYANNAVIENDLTVKGDIYLGDDLIQDTIAFGGLITSDLISGLDPYGDRYNLGTSTERWNTLYTNVGNFDNLEIFLDGTTHYIAPNSSATSNALTIGLHTDGTITDALVLEAKESLALDTKLGASGSGGDISLTANRNIILDPGPDPYYIQLGQSGGEHFQIKDNLIYTQNSNNIIEMPNTGALKIPSGTTGLRPTGVNEAAGQIRFNETEFEFEGYNGTEWGALGGGGGGTQLIDTDADTTLSVEQPEGTDTDTLVFEIDTGVVFETSGTWSPDPGQFTDSGNTHDGEPYYIAVDGFGPGVPAYLWYSLTAGYWNVTDLLGGAIAYDTPSDTFGPPGSSPVNTYGTFFKLGFTSTGSIIAGTGGSSVQPLSLSSTAGTIDVSGTLSLDGQTVLDLNASGATGIIDIDAYNINVDATNNVIIDATSTINIGSTNAATLNLGNNTSSTELSGNATSINSAVGDLSIFTGTTFGNGASAINLHAGSDTLLSDINLTAAAGITLQSVTKQIALNASIGGVIVNGPVDITGNTEVTGDLEVNHVTTPGTNGLILESPDGTRWKITVDNNGSLTTTALP
jgi:hypothetical protein